MHFYMKKKLIHLKKRNPSPEFRFPPPIPAPGIHPRNSGDGPTPGIPGTGPPPEFRLPPPIGGGSKNPAPGIPGAAPGLKLFPDFWMFEEFQISKDPESWLVWPIIGTLTFFAGTIRLLNAARLSVMGRHLLKATREDRLT